MFHFSLSEVEKLAAVLTGYFIHGAAAIYLAVIAIIMGTECVGIDFFLTFLIINADVVMKFVLKVQSQFLW